MDTKTDISARADIEKLVHVFYEKVKKDDTIGIIFNEIVPLDWEHHIPVIIDFWETILLHADLYHKNAMTPHFIINQKFPLRAEHFEAWIKLFVGTVNDLFSGPVANMAITRAKGIAAVMQIKMDNINNISA